MIARVATFEGTPQQLAEAARLIRDEVHPRNATSDGYIEGLFLTDLKSGSGLLISLWTDEEAVRHAEDEARRRGSHGVLELTGGHRSSVRVYEVASAVRGASQPRVRP